ncbi:miRNA 5'-monophosphate methyltransferase [Seminavis robusta]|uniref:RNA methyltransferase n=1 Tax=Seminavis robusta TaxID=568900 RepID=A0A9N8HAP1_9STRA|nr:miRNA 5'-monophosphate methyltransferase [Seminavis robusta]|eukprot:Sro155_g070520.1 miRNA 5'-monophosphate methyltransferase (378) ;mRNA; f:91138-92404
MRRTRISVEPESSHGSGNKRRHEKPLVEIPQELQGEGGHRYGNFHNYYEFHPTIERLKLLERPGGILDYVSAHWREESSNKECARNDAKVDDTPAAKGDATTEKNEYLPARKKSKLTHNDTSGSPSNSVTRNEFSYLDVGCNEGDLTLQVAKALSQRLATNSTRETTAQKDTKSVTIKTHGWDVDPVLIGRAKQKHAREDDMCNNPQFHVVNVLDNDNNHVANAQDKTYDLTSIFSTTMWIHIHGGDEGLCQVLGHLCHKTRKYLLIEPQPSKCYRSAMVRLRKMGLPEFDVSADRLRLRPRIEAEIDRILNQHSFSRVVDLGANINPDESKTVWKRSIWLYQRTNGPSAGEQLKAGDNDEDEKSTHQLSPSKPDSG